MTAMNATAKAWVGARSLPPLVYPPDVAEGFAAHTAPVPVPVGRAVHVVALLGAVTLKKAQI